MVPTLVPGLVIAQRYRLTRLLGQGGMGTVWAATHTVTRRHVAIKLPRQSVVPEVRRRFLREAIAIASIDHPNVVRLHDAFELDDGTPIIVMDLLKGETFGGLLERRQTLSLPEALRVLLPVVSAVGTAHAFGVVHRDLKPDNVFLSKTVDQTVVKVLDFGIAKLGTSAEGSTTVTTTGATVGTPCYMAPEQCFGENDVDQRADVWAIGVMLYEALSGGRPIEGDSVGQVVKHLLTEALTPIGAAVPDLPEDVKSLVGRMLARNKEERSPDLREAMTVLSRHSDTRSPPFGAPRSFASSEAPDDAGEPGSSPSPSRALSTHAPRTFSHLPRLVARASPRRIGALGASVLGAVAGLAVLGFLVGRIRDESGAASQVPTGAVEPTSSPAGLAPAPVRTAALPSAAATLQAAAKSSIPASAVAASALSASAALSAHGPSTSSGRRIRDVAGPVPASLPKAAARTSSTPTAAPSPSVSRPTQRGLAEEVPF